MPSDKECTNCGVKHPPPTGRNCHALETEFGSSAEGNSDGGVTSNTGPQPGQGTVGGQTHAAVNSQLQDPAVGALLDAVTALTAKVERLESNMAPAVAQVEVDVPVSDLQLTDQTTLADLRGNPTLNARVDAMLTSGLSRRPQLTSEQQVLQEPLTTQDTGLLADILSSSAAGKWLKSPRDAPSRKIKSAVLWPNHFVTRSNASFVKYDDLTIEEFVLGMVRIIRLPEVTAVERAARLLHLENIMVSALVYQWGPVRSMYAAALEAIQYGDLTWNFSYAALKERELHPGHLLRVHSTPDQTTRPDEPCRNWNYRGCERPGCQYQHICAPCMAHYQETAYHRALECPRRKEYIQQSTQNQRYQAAPGQGYSYN